MDEFWVRALVAVFAASCGVTTVVVVLVRRHCRRTTASQVAGPCPPKAGVTSEPRPPATATSGPDASGGASSMDRCEQAVLRAERAVASISSGLLRERFFPVVRRMEAELPNVRALAELVRGLDSGAACAGGPRPGQSHAVQSQAGTSHAMAVAERTREQLDNAASRFAGIADEVLETVADLGHEQGPDRVSEQVAALREHFPLTCSLSEVLGSSVAA